MTALLTFTDGQRGFTPRFDLRPNKQSRVLVGFHGSGQTVDSPVSVESKLSRCLPWRDSCFVLADGAPLQRVEMASCGASLCGL